jgi:hypothetical protein
MGDDRILPFQSAPSIRLPQSLDLWRGHSGWGFTAARSWCAEDVFFALSGALGLPLFLFSLAAPTLY